MCAIAFHVSYLWLVILAFSPPHETTDEICQRALEACLKGHHVEAETTLNTALQQNDKLKSKSQRAALLDALGFVQSAAHKHPEARASLLESYSISATDGAATEPDLALLSFNIAQESLQTGHFRTAEQHFAKYWNSQKQTEPKANFLTHLTRLYLNAGRNDDAKRCGEMALQIWGDNGDIQKTQVYRSLASVALRNKDLTLAKKYLGLAFENKFLAPWIRLDWGRYYLAAGDLKQAERIITEAYKDEMNKEKNKQNPVFIAQLQLELARAYVQLGKTEAAIPPLNTAITLLERHLGKHSPEYLDALDFRSAKYSDRFNNDREQAQKLRVQLKSEEVRGTKEVFESIFIKP
ncbi:MAG: hypothetical protein K8U57_23690 [Planctomycetes bacterium]|nr:hypothetical protein [Planctomycetota bacterium]